MNILKKENNKIIKLESYFKKSKNDKTKDDLDNEYPYPKEGKFWTDKEQFLDKLSKIEKFVILNKNFHNFEEIENCLLCDNKDTIVSTGYYLLDNIIWKNSLIHYIMYHSMQSITNMLVN